METLALIAPYVMMAGTGISAVSGIVQGGTQAEAARAQGEAYRSQGEASRYNAAVARQQGVAIQQAAAFEEDKQRKKGLQLLGTQQALYGKAGVTMEGTPLEVMSQTAADIEKEILGTRYNYDVQRWRTLSEADQYDYMAGRQDYLAKVAKKSAGYASTAGWLKGGTSLLTGLGMIGKFGVPGKSLTSPVDYDKMYSGGAL